MLFRSLIYKGTSQSDARYSVLYLTKEGKEIVPKIIEKENEFDKELAQFLEKNIGLEQMMSILKEYLKGTNSEKKLKMRSIWE